MNEDINNVFLIMIQNEDKTYSPITVAKNSQHFILMSAIYGLRRGTLSIGDEKYKKIEETTKKETQ